MNEDKKEATGTCQTTADSASKSSRNKKIKIEGDKNNEETTFFEHNNNFNF